MGVQGRIGVIKVRRGGVRVTEMVVVVEEVGEVTMVDEGGIRSD